MRWALALSALAHLALALTLGLSVDEAHYALYAAHLDWSYFDHPPLVGWLQWPAVALGGSDALLRAVPLACSALTAWLLWRLARLVAQALGPMPDQHGPFTAERVASGAVWLWLLSPMVHLLGLALVPDTLLMPLALLTLMATWRLMQRPQALRDWLWLGLWLGLAGLAKYTAVLWVPAVCFGLSWSHGVRWLRGPGPWLAALIAGLLVAPVVIWNALNGWVSFAYQLQHAGGRHDWQLTYVLVFALVQLLAYGALSWWGVCAGWRSNGPARQHPLVLLCLAFAVSGMALVWLSAGRGSALPHWTAAAWLCLLPIAAWVWPVWVAQRPRWWLLAVGCQAACCLALAMGLWLGQPANPFADVKGWQAASEQAVVWARQRGLTKLTVINWSLASRLAWYARPLPVVVFDGHQDQFDRWFGRFQPGDDALWVNWTAKPYGAPLRNAQSDGFEQCSLLGSQSTMVLGQELARFDFHHCANWQASP